MASQHRLVEGVCRGLKTFLVTWMRIDLQEELEDLCDRAAFSFVGLLCVEVQQEPPQTVAAPTLGSDVVIHPRAGVAHRRKGPAALTLVMVVEANDVGAPAALGDIRPCRALRPRPSQLSAPVKKAIDSPCPHA